MESKKPGLRFVLFFTIPQLAGYYYILLNAAERISDNLGFLVALPYLLLFPIGVFVVLAAVGFYTILWWWIEPIIFFIYTRKTHFKTHWPRIYWIKVASFIILPFVLLVAPEIAARTNPELIHARKVREYTGDNLSPRCSKYVNDWGTELGSGYFPEISDESKYYCREQSEYCEWSTLKTDPVPVYACCPTDPEERLFKHNGRYIYPHCVDIESLWSEQGERDPRLITPTLSPKDELYNTGNVRCLVHAYGYEFNSTHGRSYITIDKAQCASRDECTWETLQETPAVYGCCPTDPSERLETYKGEYIYPHCVNIQETLKRDKQSQ